MELAQNILMYAALLGALGFLVLKFFFPKVLKSKKSGGKTGCGTDCGC